MGGDGSGGSRGNRGHRRRYAGAFQWKRVRWLVVLMLLVSPAAAWTQTAGDMGHRAVADLPPGPWDVADRYVVLEDGELLNRIHGPGMVSSPHGILGVARVTADDTCIGIHIEDARAGAFSRTPLPACLGGVTQAYIAQHDLLLVCEVRSAPEARLVAYRGATWQEAWSVHAADVGLTAGTTGGMAAGCFGAAHDPATDEVVLAWVASRHMADLQFHRITSLDAGTGAIRWSTTVPTSAMARAGFVAQPSLTDHAADWAPMAVTLTSNGLLVNGFSVCVDAALCEDLTEPNPTPVRFSSAWLTREGEPKGMMWAGGDPADSAQGQATPHGFTFGTLYAGATLGSATTLLGNELVTVDPLAAAPTQRTSIAHVQALPEGFASFPQPVPYDGGHILTIESLVTSLDRDGTIRWQFGDLGKDWLPGFVTPTTAGGELLRLFVRCGDPGSFQPFEPFHCENRLVVLDAETGKLQQTLDTAMRAAVVSEPAAALPNGEPALQYFAMDWFAPIPDGFVWGGPAGEVVVFQHHQASVPPAARIDHMHPQPDQPVTIRIDRDEHPEATHVGINWGNGMARHAWTEGDFEQSHRFQQAGRHAVTVTVQAPNQTQTHVFPVHVAGRPDVGPPGRMAAIDAPARVLPGDDVYVHVPEMSHTVELLAEWGDGSVELIPWNGSARELHHVYEEVGNVSARFTTVFQDGATATRTHTFQVGVFAEASVAALPWPPMVWLAALAVLWAMALRRPRQHGLPVLVGLAAGLVLAWLRGPSVEVMLWAGAIGATLGTTSVQSIQWAAAHHRDTRAQKVRPGVRLDGRYRVGRPIGKGAEGIVYAGRGPGGQRVALKTTAWKPDHNVLERLMAVDHPNVARILDVLEVQGGRCIVMEHAGRELRTPLAPDAWGAVARQTLAGLAALHDAGILHRDLKPSNVLVHEEAKITDFGISSLMSDEVTQLGLPQGTAAYMSPEQAMGQRLTVASDTYSLCAVLYAAWTGHPPATPEPNETFAEFHLRLTKGIQANLDHIHPKALGAWFGQGLHHNPAKRFQSAADMADALDAIGDVRP